MCWRIPRAIKEQARNTCNYTLVLIGYSFRNTPDFCAFDELDSGNLLYDLDVDHVAVNDGDPLVLPVTQRVIIHSGLIAIIGHVSCVHWIRIIIIDQVYGHAHYDVAPADIIIPSPAKSRGKANCDQPVAV